MAGGSASGGSIDSNCDTGLAAVELISLATLVAVDPSPEVETVASLQWS